MEPLSILLEAPFASHSPWTFPAAFLAGVASVCTPCVLPMVPLTLRAISVRTDVRRTQRVVRAVTFALGIATTYTVLGYLAGRTGSMVSAIFQHPVTHVGLALTFVALAASAFGFWIMQLPEPLRTHASRISGARLPSIFAIGCVAGLLALPCTGPILTALLVIVGSAGHPGYGAALLATHALGFALPFACIGIGLAQLPKRGAWLTGVEHAMGIALLVAALWFLRNAVPSIQEFNRTLGPVHTAIAGGLAVAALLCSAAGAVAVAHARAANQPLSPRTQRRVRRVHLTGISGVLFGSLSIMNAIAAPRLHGWCAESPEGTCAAEACAHHNLTVIDFGATWCTSCRQLERTTLAHPEVAGALQPHGRVSVDIDAIEGAERTYALRGVPTIAFFDRSCNREVRRITGYVTPAEFLDALRAAEVTVR